MGKFKIKNQKQRFKDVNSFLGNQFKKYNNSFQDKLKKQLLATGNQQLKHDNNQNNRIGNHQFKRDKSKNHNNNIGLRRETQEEILQQRQSLPVFHIKDQVLKALRKHQTMILIGETASGKTTQIPQFIYEAGIHGKHAVAITQPRRVAATSIASRVSTEMNTELGQLVGYSVRFDDKTSASTVIKFLTDGMLLRESISDPLLSKYSVIILDEAHERSIQTDVLLGIVKRCQALRSKPNDSGDTVIPLKVVIMSATMDVDHFSKYFNDAPVFYLEGRTYPIEKFYCSSPETDYVEAALVTVLQIHRSHPEDGDILVFCTGQEEINGLVSATQTACRSMPPGLMKLLPLPLHASLPPSEQLRVFDPSVPGVSRKVIYSTNVAETSLTIRGVRFVVDTCRVKARNFNAKTGFETLRVEKISRAQAEQRAGRAGREAPGICYRLLTDTEFAELQSFSIPEILRVNLSNVALQLIAVGIRDILKFDFMDKPKKSNIRASICELLDLEAIEQDPDESQGVGLKLTPLGKQMVIFPLEPKLSKILIESKEFGCTEEMITILSMLYVDNIFYIPANKRDEASDVIKKFSSSEGDHIKLLKVFRAYSGSKGNKEWARDNFINVKNMQIVMDVRKQLIQVWERLGIKRSSCGVKTEQVRRCLLKGLFGNIAVLTRDGIYRTKESKQEVFIHPSSCLFGCKPETILYSDLIHTTKNYMRNISLISLDWTNNTDKTSSQD